MVCNDRFNSFDSTAIPNFGLVYNRTVESIIRKSERTIDDSAGIDPVIIAEDLHQSKTILKISNHWFHSPKFNCCWMTHRFDQVCKLKENLLDIELIFFCAFVCIVTVSCSGKSSRLPSTLGYPALSPRRDVFSKSWWAITSNCRPTSATSSTQPVNTIKPTNSCVHTMKILDLSIHFFFDKSTEQWVQLQCLMHFCRN